LHKGRESLAFSTGGRITDHGYGLQRGQALLKLRLTFGGLYNTTEDKEEEMNKGDLINEVAKVVGTKKEAQAAVDCVFDTITRAMKKRESVSLVGFGTFKVDKRKARKGRNPRTGEEIKIKAKNVPKFVPGKGLKDAVG
jgi:nucleoid DNA-binding protein